MWAFRLHQSSLILNARIAEFNAVLISRSIIITLVAVPLYILLVVMGAGHLFQPIGISNSDELSDLAKLGEFLFNDTNLSEPRGLACVTCHDPKLYRQGNNNSKITAVALGSRPNIFGHRNVPTSMYEYDVPSFTFQAEKLADGTIEHVPQGGLFWDGRADNLADQAAGPMLNPAEMNNPNVETIIGKIQASQYASLARAVFGTNIFDNPKAALEKFTTAISAYEKTDEFSPFSSKFDNYLRGTMQLTEIERLGFELFKDPNKGNCLACHIGDVNSHISEDWLFTDFTYDVLGAPRNHDIPKNANPQFYDLGLCAQPKITSRAPKGFDISTLCGAFKVPSLRNVAATGPYFHNGSIANLRDAVKFYVTRDTQPQLWYPTDTSGKVLKYNDLPPQFQKNVNTGEVPYMRKRGETPQLNDAEIDAIVEFLKTLTDQPNTKS